MRPGARSDRRRILEPARVETARRAGDFIQRDLAAAVDKEAITRAAVTEIIEHGRERKSWLAFCSGVEHARHVAEEFGRQGITCRTIFGDTPKDERDAIIAAF
jgi:DNA repair protein RadD